MYLFSRMFGRRTSKAYTTSTTSSFATNSLKSTGWYFAEDKSIGLRQIVCPVGGSAPTKSRFASLILPAYKYGPLLGNLAVGFFRMENDSGPFLLVKTPNFAKKMAAETVTLAFTFCHMSSGPLFSIFVHSPSTEKELRNGCFIDQVYNVHDFGDMINDAFRKQALHIVFAQVDGMFGTECLLDTQYNLDQALRDTFSDQWGKLLAHGRALRTVSFEASLEELYERTPINRSPVLSR